MAQELIASLSEGLRPVPRAVAVRRLASGLGAGAAASAVLTFVTVGWRPDMAAAAGGAMFWVKLAYTLAIAIAAAWAVERLARPAGGGLGRAVCIGAPVAALLLLAVWRWLEAPAALRAPLLMGGSALTCPFAILGFSLPPLAGLIWAARGLAPVRLRLTGLVIGLAAGGAGAAAYALHCSESAAPFVAAWYSAGIGAAGLLGAAAGPRLLRW